MILATFVVDKMRSTIRQRQILVEDFRTKCVFHIYITNIYLLDLHSAESFAEVL